jgi:hypothetical protein
VGLKGLAVAIEMGRGGGVKTHHDLGDIRVELPEGSLHQLRTLSVSLRSAHADDRRETHVLVLLGEGVGRHLDGSADDLGGGYVDERTRVERLGEERSYSGVECGAEESHCEKKFGAVFFSLHNWEGVAGRNGGVNCVGDEGREIRVVFGTPQDFFFAGVKEAGQQCDNSC